MSLVGTRPPTVDEWEKYELYHRARLAAKPGLTGMWQVSGRSNITDFEEVVRLDKEYINNWNIHLLLETDRIEVDKFMKRMSERYAMYFNHKYSYRGHVFEGRYKSCLVRDDAYFLQTSRYIHLNPVKAGIITRPEEYFASSYCTMIGIVIINDISVVTENIVEYLEKRHLELTEE